MLLFQCFYMEGVLRICSWPVFKKYEELWDFPGSPVIKTLCFHFRGHRFDSWAGTKIVSDTWHGQHFLKSKELVSYHHLSLLWLAFYVVFSHFFFSNCIISSQMKAYNCGVFWFFT